MGKWPTAAAIQKLQRTIGGTADGKWGDGTWLRLFDYIHKKTDGREVADLQLMPAPDLVKARIYRLDTTLEKAPNLQEKRILLELLKTSGPNEIANMQFSMELKRAYGDLEVRLISAGTSPGGAPAGTSSGGSTARTNPGDNNKNQANGLLNSLAFWIIVVLIVFLICVVFLMLMVKKQSRHRNKIYANLRIRFDELISIMGKHKTEDGNLMSLAESIAAVRKLTANMQDDLLRIGRKVEPQGNWGARNSPSMMSYLKPDTLKETRKRGRFLNRVLGTYALSELLDSLEEISDRIGQSESLKIDGRDASLADNVIGIARRINHIREDVEYIHLAVRKPAKEEKLVRKEDNYEIATQVLNGLESEFGNLNDRFKSLEKIIFSEFVEQKSPAPMLDGAELADRSQEAQELLKKMEGSLLELRVEQHELQKNLIDSFSNTVSNMVGGLFAGMSSRARRSSSDRIDSTYRRAFQSNLDLLYRQRLMDIATSEDEYGDDGYLNLCPLWAFIEYWRLTSNSDRISKLLVELQNQILKAKPALEETIVAFPPPLIESYDEQGVLKTYRDLRRQIDQFKSLPIFANNSELRRLQNHVVIIAEKLSNGKLGYEELYDGLLRLVSLKSISISIEHTMLDATLHEVVPPDGEPAAGNHPFGTILRVVKPGYMDRKTGEVRRKTSVVVAAV